MNKQVIITNNPKIKDYYENLDNSVKEMVELLFCENRDEVFERVRNHIHQNWVLVNHAMAGNIPLHKHPYRTMALRHELAMDIESLNLWENAMERVTRGTLPAYDDKTLLDFQDLDYLLFTDNFKI